MSAPSRHQTRGSTLIDSEHIHITGGYFTNTTHTLNIDGKHDLDILLKHTVLEAMHDSGDRLDRPRCDPDTRVLIIEKILAWIAGGESPSMLWARGSAGVGKTALAQSIAERASQKKYLLASFFFSGISQLRSDGKFLVATIVYQLISNVPETRSLVQKVLTNDPLIFDKSLDTQMTKLIIEPLNCIPKKRSARILAASIQPRLIVVDGLDECSDGAVQRELVRVISDAAKRLDYPIKFLITSRPEAHIDLAFKDGAIRGLSRINLSEDVRALKKDIQTFLRKAFLEIKKSHVLQPHIPNDWPGADTIDTLVHKSSGQFIYASTVINYVKSPKRRPTERLDIVLGLSSSATSTENPFAQLDALYRHILSSVDHKWTVLKILGVLIIPRKEDDDFGDYSTPAMLQQLLFLQPGDVELALNDLLSVLTFSTPDAPIRLLHASLAEYLLTPSRALDFYVNLRLSHAALARGYLNYTPTEHKSVAFWNPIITHLRRAEITRELWQDLLHFDISGIFTKVLPSPPVCPPSISSYGTARETRDSLRTIYYMVRDKSSDTNSSENTRIVFPTDTMPYPWFWINNFMSSLLAACSQYRGKDLDTSLIHTSFLNKLDQHFRKELVRYSRHEELLDFLAVVAVYIGLSKETQDDLCSCMRDIAEPKFSGSRARFFWDIDRQTLNLWNFLKLIASFPDSQLPSRSNLWLMSDFLTDPERAEEHYISGELYAHAALRCLTSICAPIDSELCFFPFLMTDRTYFNGTCLECATAFLSKAAQSEELVSFLIDNIVYLAWLEGCFPDQGKIFAAVMKHYLQCAEDTEASIDWTSTDSEDTRCHSPNISEPRFPGD
ncbi:hypothetical protein B0H34DRAFT_83081 [Crassisporium funariophilum]|nr:hypothetical protein B0H34DRAFT_83081 [Crassisporium funariophilum]